MPVFGVHDLSKYGLMPPIINKQVCNYNAASIPLVVGNSRNGACV